MKGYSNSGKRKKKRYHQQENCDKAMFVYLSTQILRQNETPCQQKTPVFLSPMLMFFVWKSKEDAWQTIQVEELLDVFVSSWKCVSFF